MLLSTMKSTSFKSLLPPFLASCLLFLKTTALPQSFAISLPTQENSQQNFTVTIDDEIVPIEHPSYRRHLQRRDSHPVICNPVVDGAEYKFNNSNCISPGTQSWQCQGSLVDPDQEDMFGSEDLWDMQHHFVYGSCATHQICVDGARPATPSPPSSPREQSPMDFTDDIAFCSDIEDYISLTTGRVRKLKQQKPMTWYYMHTRSSQGSSSGTQSGGSASTRYSGGSSGQHSAEVVFATHSEVEAIVMSSLSITAQASTLDLANGRQWTDLGTQQCTKCNRIGFTDVPEHTSRFLVYPTFPVDVDTGMAFLWSH